MKIIVLNSRNPSAGKRAVLTDLNLVGPLRVVEGGTRAALIDAGGRSYWFNLNGKFLGWGPIDPPTLIAELKQQGDAEVTDSEV